MKVKMREQFQGRGVSATRKEDGLSVNILHPGVIYIVGAELGGWLVEHNKAELLPEPKPIPKPEPEPEPEPKPVPQPRNKKKVKR